VGGISGRGPFHRKQRPDIGAAVAASLTGELRFESRQPDMIGPAIGVDHDRMRAFVIGAVDEKSSRAGSPHFAESDFLFTHASPRHWSMAYQSAVGTASASRYSLRRDAVELGLAAINTATLWRSPDGRIAVLDFKRAGHEKERTTSREPREQKLKLDVPTVSH
jgi:hypothetical protein